MSLNIYIILVGIYKVAFTSISASFLYWFLVKGFLTVALVLAALKKDPHYYNHSPLDIFRGICEGITLLLITLSLLVQIRTIYLYV